MARPIKTRIGVRGRLCAKSPLHVGGIGGDAETDLAIAKDGRERYYIPGTSLAGAFRAWVTEHCGTEIADKLWGFQKDNQGHASFLTIADTALDIEPTIEIRDGVGIDRVWGAAADTIKYDRAVLPMGTTFDLQMYLDLPVQKRTQDADDRVALNALLDALCHGRIRLGAAKSRGLGRVQLLDCEVLEQTLDTCDGMLSLLKTIAEPSRAAWTLYRPAIARTSPQFIITIDWQPVDALMVKSDQEGLAVDMLPLTSQVDQDLALVLPGSSIKGVLRSQAERILRTVCPATRTNDTARSLRDRFLNQLEVPLVKTLFGRAAKPPTEIIDPCLLQPGISALFVEDCYSQQHMTTAEWNAVLQAQDSAALIAALKAANLSDTQQAFHVAIDRWTGGAAENMLYSTLEPFKIAWNPIVMELQLRRIPTTEHLSAIALLLLTLRDFALGKLPLGYGGNRGLGAIQVNTITLTATNLKGTALENDTTQQTTQQTIAEITIDRQGAISTNHPHWIQQIETDWQSWISLQNSHPLPTI